MNTVENSLGSDGAPEREHLCEPILGDRSRDIGVAEQGFDFRGEQHSVAEAREVKRANPYSIP